MFLVILGKLRVFLDFFPGVFVQHSKSLLHSENSSPASRRCDSQYLAGSFRLTGDVESQGDHDMRSEANIIYIIIFLYTIYCILDSKRNTTTGNQDNRVKGPV